MARRKSAEERFAAIIQEIGLERAESAFRLLKSYTAPKPEPKQRKKPVTFQAKTGTQSAS